MPIHSGATLSLALLIGSIPVPSSVPRPDSEEIDPNTLDRLQLDGEEEPVVCRVLWRWADDGKAVTAMLPSGKRKEVPKDEVLRIDARRDRTAAFLDQRRPGDDVGRSWELALLAEEERLPYLARVQAWHVLTLDPGHAEAHRMLGHEQRSGAWRWRLAGDELGEDDFHERILDWKDRLVLEGEHFIVESDAGLERTVQTVFDLERVYTVWMERFAQILGAAEDVDLLTDKMTLFLYRSKEDDGFRAFRTQDKEPFYDPTRQTTTRGGNPNVAFTYYVEDAARPLRLFDIATQQVLYSTMTYGRHAGDPPANSLSLHAHWVELGLGYWIERQLTGPPGHAALQVFAFDPEEARLALERPAKGPLRSQRGQLANLIGLETTQFYRTGDIDLLHRAKARAFVAYLLEVDPPVHKRGRSEVVGSGREGLLCYLREAYGTATAHSSSRLDACLGDGARVESLEDGWREWMASVAR